MSQYRQQHRQQIPQPDLFGMAGSSCLESLYRWDYRDLEPRQAFYDAIRSSTETI